MADGLENKPQARGNRRTIDPGPIDPRHGCPDPIEIICLYVDKVYDFCFQTERREDVCLPLPRDCEPLGEDVVVRCHVDDVDCREIDRESLRNGFANVTLRIHVTLRIEIDDSEGRNICCFKDSLTFRKSVFLCAPKGTRVHCEVSGSRCGPAEIIRGEVCTDVDLCVVIQSVARVKVLVPSFGFCEPHECIPLERPPLSCPPGTMFPEQCVPFFNGNTAEAMAEPEENEDGTWDGDVDY